MTSIGLATRAAVTPTCRRIANMSDIQSNLARHQPQASTSDGELKAMGARAWEDHETLVVRLSTVSDPVVKGMIKAIAAHVFGRPP